MNEYAIRQAIDSHLECSPKQYYSDFYIGITDNIEERLFGFHRVPRSGHWFIWRPADSADVARRIEKYYLDKGMDGGTGGGDGDTRYVYCYEKEAGVTRER